MASKSDKIGATNLTIEWLQGQLQDCLQTSSALTDWSVTEIGEGKGYLSQILRVSLVWDLEAKHLPSSVILKVPSGKQIQRIVDSNLMNEEMNDFYGNKHLVDGILGAVRTWLPLFPTDHLLGPG